MWAESHFPQHVEILAEELAVFLVVVQPAYTSQSCMKYQHCPAENPAKWVFGCAASGNRTDADIYAGRVIALKSSENVAKILTYGSGSIRGFRRG